MKLLYHAKIQGKIPSKKNAYTPGRYGGVYVKKGPAKLISDIVLQLKGAKGPFTGLPAGKNLSVMVQLFGKSRCDGDNRFTTLLDCLQTAGVIKNDKDVKSGSYDIIDDVKAEITIVEVYAK